MREVHNLVMTGIHFLNELKVIADQQVASWRVNYADDSADGPCPFCGHPTVATFVKEAVSMGSAPELAPQAKGLTRLFQCKCGQPHMDGTVARQNCGRRWLVKIRPEGVQPPVVAADDYSLLEQSQIRAPTPDPVTGKVTRTGNEVFKVYVLLLQRLRLIWVPVFLLAIWGLGSYFYETQKSSASLSLIYGSVLAIVFVSAGAVGVGWILNARVAESERRALAAERLAEQYRNDAAKGRALAAALLAADAPEGPTAFPGVDIRRQQAQFARLLFGDLVVQSPSTGNSNGLLPGKD